MAAGRADTPASSCHSSPVPRIIKAGRTVATRPSAKRFVRKNARIPTIIPAEIVQAANKSGVDAGIKSATKGSLNASLFVTSPRAMRVNPAVKHIQRRIKSVLCISEVRKRARSNPIGGTEGKTYPGSLDREIVKKTMQNPAQSKRKD